MSIWLIWCLFLLQMVLFESKIKRLNTALLLWKGKRQYLLTCKENIYCLLPLHGSIYNVIRYCLFALHCKAIPENKSYCPNSGSMLAHRRRRWTNIEPELGQCIVFAEVDQHWISIGAMSRVCWNTNYIFDKLSKPSILSWLWFISNCIAYVTCWTKDGIPRPIIIFIETLSH